MEIRGLFVIKTTKTSLKIFLVSCMVTMTCQETVTYYVKSNILVALI